MEPFNHVLKQAADITIRGEYTTRNLPGGVDLLTLAAGATLTLSGDLVEQFAAVNATANAEQGRPQSALEGAVKPNQTAGSTNAPQAGSTVASSGFSLGEGAPDASGNIIVPYGSGEFKIIMDGEGPVNVGIDIPADANVTAKSPAQMKFRSEGDKLWGIVTLSQSPGFIAQSDKDNGPSASLGLAYVNEPGTVYQQLEPGVRYWLNVEKKFVGTLVFQHTIPG